MAYVSKIKDSNNSTYNIRAYKAAAIPFGQVDSTSTSTVFTATVDGIDELYDGVCVWLRNGVVNSAAGCTLNINQLGAKPIYSSLASADAISTLFAVGYTMLFIYNSSRITGGCWDVVATSGNYNDLNNKPTIPTVTLNGSTTASPNFYAPTSAGTSGYILKSNGSGAPSWVQMPTDNNTTYGISMSSNIITLMGSDGNSSTIALPIYDGSVSVVGG